MSGLPSNPCSPGSPSTFNRRRSVVVRGFHGRFLTAHLTWTIGLLALFSLVLLGPTTSALLTGTPNERLAAATTFIGLHGALWPAFIGFVAASVAVITLLSHRVAGPMHRFRSVFDAVSAGQLWVSAKIREGDYPVAESEALEHMLVSLRARVAEARVAMVDTARVVDAFTPEMSPDAVMALKAAVERLEGALSRFELQPPGCATADVAVRQADTSAQSELAPGRPDRSPRQPPQQSKAGFTLVEILLVIAIVGILAAIALPAYSTILEVARVTRAVGDIRGVDREIQSHRALNGCLPSTLGDMGYGHLKDPWGSPYVYQVLEIPPSGGGAGKGGKGGGGASSCAACNGGCVGKGQARKDRNLVPVNSDYDFFSLGKDRRSASALTAGPSQDDIVRASDGGFIGLGRDY